MTMTTESAVRPHAVRNYIGGRWVSSTTTGTSYSPATGEPLGDYYEVEPDQVREAIRIAADVFAAHEWQRDRQLRARVLNEMAERVEAASDELALLLARENGKTLPEAAFELSLTPSKLRYYAAQALTDVGRGGRVRSGMYSMLLAEPIGVAGVIVPWNSPVVLSVRSFAPALAAGCTVVMKMAAQTALVNARLAELLADCPSLPDGVLNIFTESGSVGAKLLVSSPEVAGLSYTGSTAVGRQIMADSGATLKRLSLELGGKTPMIVFDDADIDAAVATIVASVTTFTGQFCMTGSRILVQRSIADRVREKLVNAFEQVRVGPGDRETSDMGPMIDIAARDRLVELVAAHSADVETLVAGGRPEDPELAGGAYFRPALLAVDDVNSALVQRELFGPVATFEVFDTEEDAVQLANATEYGLAASVWTQHGPRGLRLAEKLDVGTVWTNGWAVVVDQFEEGGYKQSGLGRLNGHRGLAEFQEYKHVVQLV